MKKILRKRKAQKNRVSERSVRKGSLGGYLTLEAAMVFPAVFALVIMLLYGAFFLYDKCRMTQLLYTAAYRQSIVRGESALDASVDTSAFFMLSGCTAEVGGGGQITASAGGEMAPALLTAAEGGGTAWQLKVSMQARKTDPPRSFRKFRRTMAVAAQVLGEQ